MADFFDKHNNNGLYFNTVRRDNPAPAQFNNGCGFSNCCGLAATGDEPEPDPAPVKANVTNLQAWQYIKTGLAIIGVYVVLKFLYGKFIK
jgi:hypothetical protein